MRISLNCTGALGDSVMLSCLASALSAQGHVVTLVVPDHFASLFKNNPNVSSVTSKLVGASCDACVDLQGYLSGLPHTTKINGAYKHLTYWMGVALNEQLPALKLTVSSASVIVFLSEDEISTAKQRLEEVKLKTHSQAIALVSSSATSKNRNIPKDVLEDVARPTTSRL